ncbi:hypothetical protein KY312_02750 [Candidatus Woesearchaeota archaeon]|nr:hypothetical protein [Candidatus Woesearchaeota archaeon]
MKRAQATGASALVAIIMILIIMYILFLPPESREELLEDKEAEEEEEVFNESRVILFEHPGRLDEVDELENKQSLPSVYLSSIYENKLLEQENTIYIWNKWFSEKPFTLEFDFPAVENTKNTLLSFNVNQFKGRLIVNLNEKLVYNNEISQPSIAPIVLPAKHLKQGRNKLEFRVSGVGGKFWATNEYTLTQAKVTSDVKDISAQQAQTTFLITTSELLNMQKAKLTYYPDCSPGQVNPLDIYLNNRLLVSSIPDCGSLHRKEFLPDRLITGENELIFKTTKGSYLMRDVSITTYMEEPSYPTYYFELDDNQMEEIEDEGLNMTFKFLTTVFKNLEVSVNGRTIFIDTRDKTHEEDISDLVREGTNAIKITPLSSGIDILDFRVMINED